VISDRNLLGLITFWRLCLPVINSVDNANVVNYTRMREMIEMSVCIPANEYLMPATVLLVEAIIVQEQWPAQGTKEQHECAGSATCCSAMVRLMRNCKGVGMRLDNMEFVMEVLISISSGKKL